MKRLIAHVWFMIDVIIAVLLLAMIVMVFSNVVLRYGFSSGIGPSVELARLWFVWVVMLGAAVALRRDEHLSVAEFSAKMFPRAVSTIKTGVLVSGDCRRGHGVYRLAEPDHGELVQHFAAYRPAFGAVLPFGGDLGGPDGGDCGRSPD